jgi:hypothetical protein
VHESAPVRRASSRVSFAALIKIKAEVPRAIMVS